MTTVLNAPEFAAPFPSAVRPPTSIAAAALGAGLALWGTDVATALWYGSDGGSALYWAAAAAAVAGSMAGAVAAALCDVGRRFRDGGAAATAAFPALFVGLVSAPLVRETLVGRGAQQSVVLSTLRTYAWAILPAAAWAGLSTAIAVGRRAARSSAGRGAAAAACVAAVVGCGFFDAVVHADRYPAAHALSRLAAALAGAGAASLLLHPARVRVVWAALAVWTIFGLSGAVVDPLTAHPQARRAAFHDTSLLRLALLYLAPTPAPPSVSAAEALAAVASAPAPDPAALDRAFPGRRDLNVLFVTVDAWRGDALDAERAGEPVMPRLREFAAGASRFDEAWAAFPMTSQGFSGIFSGRHNPATDVGRAMTHERKWLSARTDTTLADLLLARGYRTEAVVGFPANLEGTVYGVLKKGMQHWNRDPRMRVPPITADHVAAAGLDALDREPERPFFLWVHFFEPHAPYEPLVERYGTSPRELYDAELHDVDAAVGRLLHGLEARGLGGRTAVALFGDHGEEFRTRGPQYHATAVTHTQLHVPLLLRVPGAAPARFRNPVSLIDVAPTVLSLLDVAGPWTHGRSLLPLLARGADDPQAPARPIYAELVGPEPHRNLLRYAVRLGDLKYERNDDLGTEGLFDLAHDHEEERNLIDERPADAARLRRLLDVERVRAALPPADADSRPR
jgi:arylsulfatase A-like enzyme